MRVCLAGEEGHGDLGPSFLAHMQQRPDRHSLDSWSNTLLTRPVNRPSMDAVMKNSPLIQEDGNTAGAAELDPDVSHFSSVCVVSE